MTGRLPVPPEDVRIRLDDGREIPVELAYAGRNADGMHIWESTQVFPPRVTAVWAGMIPAHTAVSIRTDDDP